MDLTIRFIWNDTKEEVINTITDCENYDIGTEKWFQYWQLANNYSTLEELLKEITVLDIRPPTLEELMSDYCIRGSGFYKTHYHEEATIAFCDAMLAMDTLVDLFTSKQLPVEGFDRFMGGLSRHHARLLEGIKK